LKDLVINGRMTKYNVDKQNQKCEMDLMDSGQHPNSGFCGHGDGSLSFIKTGDFFIS
jgi:hypothetical protein